VCVGGGGGWSFGTWLFEVGGGGRVEGWVTGELVGGVEWSTLSPSLSLTHTHSVMPHNKTNNAQTHRDIEALPP
jgi:hypothetical protein